MLKLEGDIRIPAGCAIAAVLNRSGQRFDGSTIIASIATMHKRSNGLGGGFAAYGVYPQYRDHYALHIFYDDVGAQQMCERYLMHHFRITEREPVPVRYTRKIARAPLIWRYFALPREDSLSRQQLGEEDFVAAVVMTINSDLGGAYVVSSGRNMAAFKGEGYPEDIGEFFRLEEYQAYLWTAHGRFPTNTPGWWGGAHPFTLLNWSVVHNGEISSYSTNRRYLEMYGYKISLQTDTEVIAYAFDFLMRKEGLSLEDAIDVIAAPFWSKLDRERQARLRRRYASLLLNGPFSIIVATNNGLIAVNDRIKLRPLVAASRNEYLYVASEEAAIRAVAPVLDRTWSPGGGEPVIGLLHNQEGLLEAPSTGLETNARSA
ncbi:MAG: class II glutamine amidotransferase [Syntrophomonadaceae bacterium]